MPTVWTVGKEKKELMEKFQPPKDAKPIDLAQQKGDRWAKDPVTGGMVLIRDPDFKGTVKVLLPCVNPL